MGAGVATGALAIPAAAHAAALFPSSRFGFAADGNRTPRFSAATANRMMDLVTGVGASWYRFTFGQDVLYDAGRAAGISNFLACMVFDPSQSPASLAASAVAGLRRYPAVTAIEVGNEPNLIPGFSAPSYMRYLIAVRAAVKSVNPSVSVGSAGLANGGADAGAYLRSMYDHGLAANSDWVGVHPYTYPALPRAAFTGGGLLPSSRAIMVRAGDSGKKLWLTEFGASTGITPDSVSRDVQARTYSDALGYLAQQSWCGTVFAYEPFDQGAGVGPREGFFGVWDQFGNPKPAAAAIRAAIAR
ncbi:hypothetical protein GCM10009619_10620 [Williamsia maris]|uniref:Glycosyl hydrolase catalytic core n=1 Tax=Williamsia maris TaxID=72806 RepID=A0ABT1HC41_9NOCA|nr:Glycosyl hydrolase catalytic core [Williamsia maris]